MPDYMYIIIEQLFFKKGLIRCWHQKKWPVKSSTGHYAMLGTFTYHSEWNY